LNFVLSTTPHDRARHRVEHELEDATRLVWELLDEEPADALAAEAVDLPSSGWIARLDRVDFPPGGVAYRHVHPGPGIRYLLHGALTIDRGDGEPHTYRAGEAWFEGADDPVLATASATDDTAFVRVLLLPEEWAGKRTIRYIDPADEDKPRLQRAAVFSEEPVAL
jgi:quercetin dioxygenase-like cupin family protein